MEGNVFNIQRYTVHDGPGIRTEIFLKGCPLRCKWCSNPESYSSKLEVGVYQDKCIGVKDCGFCLKVCPKVKDKVFAMENGFVTGINRDVCIGCMKCTQVCPSEALKAWGKMMTVDEVMQPVLADRSLYEKSGGGITLSGGEALMQWRFVKEVLMECKKQAIHTCVESALLCRQEILDEILPYTDVFITDIKCMDDEIHRKYTGQSNALIHENIKYVSTKNVPLIIRIPVIPGINDSEDNITKTADFIINELGNRVAQVQFLRFRKLGTEKYKTLDLKYLMDDVDKEREEFELQIRKLVTIMQVRGIEAVAGSSTPLGQKQVW